MSRQLTSATTLDNLKKEAKRWLKALRAGDESARARLDRAYPKAPAEPCLRQRPRTIELLSRSSRDVWALSFTGNVARLREVLTAEPRLARLVGSESTPLMWLPGDEARALEIARLFLAHGADPSIRNKHGQTAADLARKRGLDEVADLLSR
jgi:hypothetical protein